MSMSYDKKFVSPSFTDALNKIVNPGNGPEEISESSAIHASRLKALGAKPDANAANPKRKTAADAAKTRSERRRTPEEAKKADRFSKALGGEELDEEVLTEEQIVEFLDEELGPHIEYLLDEGFTEDEIEMIIMEMLEESEEDEENVLDEKEK